MRFCYDSYNNWLTSSPEDVARYRGRCIAFSYKQERVVASGDNFNEVMRTVRELGLEDEVVLDTVMVGDEAPIGAAHLWGE